MQAEASTLERSGCGADRKIGTVAVFGSGIMGAGIAAFFADRGHAVQLYDLDRALVEKNLAKLTDPKAKIPAIMSPRSAKQIRPFGLDEVGTALPEADFIIEAVPEVLKIKRSTFETIEAHRREGSIVATNTSGISVQAMAEGRSEAFRRSFVGVHFFNPVRYMALVELIPSADTDPNVVATLQALLTRGGKTPVIGRDTPNFIANRVGVYAMLKTAQLAQKYGFTVEEVDMITGPPIGNPKTGTFRVADLVGLDTLVHVARNAYDNCPDDEEREVFAPSQALLDLVENKRLGDKTGGGYYKKTRDEKGRRAILALDFETGEYRPSTRPKADAIRVAKGYRRAQDRVRALCTYADKSDKVAQFARELVVAVGAYALNRVGEIASTAQEIDLAMRAGFGRELGPIETLDAIGLERSRGWMKELRIAVPQALEDAIQSGAGLVERPATAAGILRLADLRQAGGIVRENLSSRLWDLGDGVLCCELSAKMVPDMNPVDDYVISMMEQAFEEINSGRFQALVVSNQAKNFCAGANLMMVLELAKQKRFADIEAVTRRLQAVNLANLRAPFPVVTAPHGMTLGGGLEVAMGGQVRVCHAELYTGLVEVGVGLIPAGGGCFFLLRNLIDRGRKRNPGPMPPVMQALDLIGFGKVSSSAFDAKSKGLLRRDDVVVFSKDALLQEAKRVALSRLEGFTPTEVEPLILPGVGGRLVIEQNLDEMVVQGKLTEHSRTIARVQARILTGGDSASPANPVTVDQVFELEREGFLSLCGEPKTQERMGYMLKKGKPLIN